jgi:MerC mercury resistance protein
MTKFTLETRSGDRKAMLLATLCFIHCVAGPVLLSFAGYSSLIAASERFEPVLLLSSLILGSAVLIPAYRRKHRRCSCLALFFSGLLCLVVFRRLHWMMIPDAILTGIGVVLIIGAHALNMKFSRQCECCEPGHSREADCGPNSRVSFANSAGFGNAREHE